MCAVGKVRCLSGTGFTPTQEYAILALGTDSGVITAAVLDDNGAPREVFVDNSGFEFSELYAVTKVV
jgi:phospholipid N-methyltransferase